MPAGKQGCADATYSADVVVAAAVNLFMQGLLLDVLLQAEVQLFQEAVDMNVETMDMGMGVTDEEVVQGNLPGGTDVASPLDQTTPCVSRNAC